MLSASAGGFRDRVERFERRLIEDALRKHANTREVAKALGLSQSSVVRKLRKGKSVTGLATNVFHDR
jgi:transcriptional regulator with PAS, ATPase and Fis domain